MNVPETKTLKGGNLEAENSTTYQKQLPNNRLFTKLLTFPIDFEGGQARDGYSFRYDLPTACCGGWVGVPDQKPNFL